MALVEEPVTTQAAEAPPQSDPSLHDVLERQRAAFIQDGPTTYEHRVAALDKIKRILIDNKDAWAEAISADFGNRAKQETLLAEIFTTVMSVKHTRKHLRKWMKPKRAPIAKEFKPARGKVHHQPLGVVGIISPWNYPLQLAIIPLLQAISAGNRVMLKPSELTPRTSELLKKTIGENFSEDEVAVFTGGADVGATFSALPFDLLFYTGSTNVGRLVMQAAARNLTPVTLELGGKSPVIVGEECEIEKAIPSIASGKLLNAGQTCVAPDYVLLPETKREEFVTAFQEAAKKYYPSLRDNADYTSIVSDRHFDRISGLIDDARAHGAQVMEFNPGEEDLSGTRKIAPTLVLDATEDMKIMHEEIFGPVMPVLTYNSLDEAIRYVNEHPRPLALYYFGDSTDARDRVLAQTTSGGVAVNETLFHVAQEELPFGGVGPSGIGSYHGYAGFKTFSHQKSVFYQSKLNGNFLFRPPYGRLFNSVVKLLIGK
jgi:coniferyl-aldehyde dehydrogenase